MRGLCKRKVFKLGALFLIIIVLVVGIASPVAADTTPATTAKPTVTSVSPNQGSQGETLSVTVTGTNFTGAKGVSFGGGIKVTAFTVDSDTQITASIAIANRAPVSSRVVTVVGPSGKGTLAAGFSVAKK